MKVYIENYKGHISFTRMLPYWKKMGHKFFTNPHGCDVQFGNVRFESDTDLPKCLRIDGIYYDIDTNYNARNDFMNKPHSTADAVIYQSDYSRRLIERYLKKRKPSTIYRVIHNGIEKAWCGKPVQHDGVNIIVLSKWRRHKRLKEIIELFLEFRKEYESRLHILGMLHDNIPVKDKNIIYYGMVSRDEVGRVFRESDFSIHLSKRDSCPNSVVESIGAGVPVITTNNCGGATEICKITPGCIVVDGDGDYDNDYAPCAYYKDPWNALLPDVFSGVLSAMKKLTEEKTRVELPKELSAEYTAEQYIKVLEAIK